MNKSNIFGTGDKRDVNPSWFTAKTWMKVLSGKIKSKDQDIYHVHFENGSKTKLHSHNGNQVLIATKGKGSLEIFKRFGNSKNNFKIKRIQKITLNEGDIVHIPAKTLHTHGSVDKKKTFSHIAINILPRKNTEYKTVWYESDFRTLVSGIIYVMSLQKNSDIQSIQGNEGSKIKQYFHPHNTLNGINYSLAQFSLDQGKKSKKHKLRSSEIYYILQGKGTMRAGTDSFDVTKDDSVYVPLMTEQWIENTGDEELRFLCIVEPAWKAQDEIILE